MHINIYTRRVQNYVQMFCFPQHLTSTAIPETQTQIRHMEN